MFLIICRKWKRKGKMSVWLALSHKLIDYSYTHCAVWEGRIEKDTWKCTPMSRFLRSMNPEGKEERRNSTWVLHHTLKVLHSTPGFSKIQFGISSCRWPGSQRNWKVFCPTSKSINEKNVSILLCFTEWEFVTTAERQHPLRMEEIKRSSVKI